MWFESGFSGFSGLMITSPVWEGRLLLVGAFISKHPADALRIGEKKSIRYASTDKHHNQIDDVLCNLENPDSKPNVTTGKYYIGTCWGEDARHRVSTGYSITLTMGLHCSATREMYLYHERQMQFASYLNTKMPYLANSWKLLVMGLQAHLTIFPVS